ncbi:hypothetical protein TNCV_588151 [Trichonephila clavipes]|nr:hypothetical protein TNCV_588151 [Trichonephila clavipes]
MRVCFSSLSLVTILWVLLCCFLQGSYGLQERGRASHVMRGFDHPLTAFSTFLIAIVIGTLKCALVSHIMFHTIIPCVYQFRRLPLHRRKISVQRASSGGLRTEKCPWGPDLDCTVDAEAIQSSIHAILSSISLICDMVHCLDETALSFSSNEAAFSSFKRSDNAT